jgi:hypothetical protein
MGIMETGALPHGYSRALFTIGEPEKDQALQQRAGALVAIRLAT